LSARPDVGDNAVVSDALITDVGGFAGLQALSVAFYRRVLADELLAPVFEHFTEQHTEHVAVWLAEVFGGPADYTAHEGGHQALLRAHLGLHIQDEHRVRWLALMRSAIEEVLPGRPETAAALMAYFTWGTAIAQDVSRQPEGADLGDPGPTPRWTYQGLVS
jgi:hemoglobin